MKTLPCFINVINVIYTIVYKVGWTWQGVYLSIFTWVNALTCSSKAVRAARMLSSLHGTKVAAILQQPPGCYIQRGLLGINSQLCPWEATGKWVVRLASVFIVFLSMKFNLSVKLLILPPATESFHRDAWCYLHVYGNRNLWEIGETSTVWAAAI